jgi:diguanylate cyclase (GGDEF)-like protein
MGSALMPIRHRRQTSRLDQSVTAVLARLAGLTAVSVAVLVTCILWRSAIFQSTSTLLAANHALQLSNSGMLDEETGLRGYLAARDPILLQPYTQGEAELSQGNAGIQTLLGTEAALLEPLVNLRLAQQEWLTQWAEPALQTQPGVATLDPFLQQGKTLFDAYRGAEADLAAQLDTRLQRLEDQSTAVSNGALAVEGLLIILGGFLWWRSRLQLRTGIVGPVTRILATLERFETGDYAAPPVPEQGPAELRSIGLRLSSLASALETSRAEGDSKTREAAAHAERLRIIVEMGREITGSLNLRYVLSAVSTSVLRLEVCTRCVIWLTDESALSLVPHFDSAGVKGRVEGLEPIRVGEEVVGKAARFGRIIGPEPVSHPLVDEPWGVAIAIPMIVGARVVGVIEAGSAVQTELPPELVDVVGTMSSQAATAIEAARLYERAEHMGRTDPLTQLPNRRELDTTLAAEVSRAARYHRPLSIAMLDLDHFKKVNDTYGHARGDEILQQAAEVMSLAVRDTDTIYRYGGEEFLLLMPESDEGASLTLCDRIRRAVEEHVAVPGASADHVTVSCGVASYPADGTEASRLVKAADGALYGAKRAGRNRVRSAAEDRADLLHVLPVVAPAG